MANGQTRNRPKKPVNDYDERSGRSYSRLPTSPFRQGGESWDRDVAMRQRLHPSRIEGVGVVVTAVQGLRFPVLAECLHLIPVTRDGKILSDPDCVFSCRERNRD